MTSDPAGAEPAARRGAHPAAVAFAAVGWDDPDVQRLAAEQQAELSERYGGLGDTGPALTAVSIALVLLGRDPAGQPVACGALRPLGPGEAELKRMYVAPAARRRGVGRQLLAALEQAARERGWTTLLLDTGRRQPEAVALYESAGFIETGPFAHNVGAPSEAYLRYFVRRLPPD